MRLLIVEDDKGICTALQKGFQKMGYAVDCAADGAMALERYYSASYDVVLLDLNLPVMDGLDVLKEIRRENARQRVLILSARTEIEDKIAGLDLGADDYVGKPFHFLEVEARVRALIRRDYDSTPAAIRIGDLEVHTDKRKVFCHGEEIPLTAKEFGILEYLALHRGCPVSSEELIEHVWNEEVNELTAAVKVHINNLRKKLPEDTIKTVKGSGYYV
ncbi:MAG: response regulator transcription factor [Lachnospiraceae bacterium]|nr:response regulator transcription factor [Lachnospiraceae bacterium]